MIPSVERRTLAAIVFTDVVGSTALKQKLGDKAGIRLIQRHHELLRQTLQQFAGAREIKTAGDSFFLSFPTPSAAVSFALLLQARLRQFNASMAVPVEDRAGIHVGEVSLHGADQALDLHGLSVDLCARVMELARGRQVLMTRAVFDSARQMLKGEDISDVGALSWVSHGHYLLKGISEPVEICEVAETGLGPLGPPETTEKARRQASPGGEPVLGWRPAVGQSVGRTDWVLEEKLGEGSFGEVWVGQHRKLKDRRVFKFCFRADRVRSLKREMTLFRLIKERFGDHPNIVALREVCFDEPPYFLEEDYVQGRDLVCWCEAQGGVNAVPLETRLEIVAQVADALQAAHECGVVHRDVKPSNILISSPKSEGRAPTRDAALPSARSLPPIAKLSDFGIGQVVSEECLGNATQAEFTSALTRSPTSSQAGTQLYLAPELLAGEPATTRSDLYSLGVVLYQMLVGAFNRPLTSDWAEDVPDALLRDDLRRCVAGRPADRFAAAEQLARNLRALPQRRAELKRLAAEKAALERAAYRRGIIRAAGVAAVVIAAMAGLALLALSESRRARQGEQRAEAGERAAHEAAEAARQNLYAADMNLACQAWQENNLGLAMALLNKHRPGPQQADLRGWEWRCLWRVCRSDALYTLGQHSDGALGVFGLAISPDGKLLATIAAYAGAVNVWNLDSRQLLQTPEANEAGQSVAFSCDSRTLAFSTLTRGIVLWDVQEHREISRFPGAAQHGFGAPALAFSPDGRQLAIAALDGPLSLWDIAAHTRTRTLEGHSRTVSSAVFSPDGRTLITGSFDRTVGVWSLASGQRTAVLTNHSDSVQCVALSPDGQTAASGGWDKTIRIWDLAQRRQRAILTNHTFWIASLAFAPDGQTLASASADCSIKFWETTAWHQIASLKASEGEAWGIAFSRDGKTLFSGTKGGKILAWDGRPSMPDSPVLSRPHDALDFGAARSRGVDFPYCWHRNNTLSLWDPRTLRPLPAHAPIDLRTNAISWALSPDGRHLAFATREGPLYLWDVETERPIACLEGWQGGRSTVGFSPRGKLLAAVAPAKGLKLWNLDPLEELAILPKSEAAPARNLYFAADDQAVAAGNTDGTVEVWDLPRKKRAACWKAHQGWVTEAAFMPDGKSLVTVGEDCSARLWEFSAQREIQSLGRTLNAFFSVAVFPDGQRIATGSADGIIKVWNPKTGHQVATLKGSSDWADPDIDLHQGDPILSLAALPPDGDELISSTSRQVQLWRAPSWAEIAAAEKAQAPAR